MNDDLDRILSEDDGIVPSSGFTRAVMAAVQREATAPPPIPFPWRRAAPLICAAGAACLAVVVNSARLAGSPAALDIPAPWMAALSSVAAGVIRPEALWLVLTLAVTAVAATLPQRVRRTRMRP